MVWALKKGGERVHFFAHLPSSAALEDLLCLSFSLSQMGPGALTDPSVQPPGLRVLGTFRSRFHRARCGIRWKRFLWVPEDNRRASQRPPGRCLVPDTFPSPFVSLLTPRSRRRSQEGDSRVSASGPSARDLFDLARTTGTSPFKAGLKHAADVYVCIYNFVGLWYLMLNSVRFCLLCSCAVCCFNLDLFHFSSKDAFSSRRAAGRNLVRISFVIFSETFSKISPFLKKKKPNQETTPGKLVS